MATMRTARVAATAAAAAALTTRHPPFHPPSSGARGLTASAVACPPPPRCPPGAPPTTATTSASPTVTKAPTTTNYSPTITATLTPTPTFTSTPTATTSSTSTTTTATPLPASPPPPSPFPPAQPSGRSARLASRFIDRITLRVSGGTGGPGATSFARGPNQAVAPPDGGHGGDGGAVTLVASTGASSLDLPSRSVTAGSGGAGRPARAAGRRGTDAVIEVPLGTAVVAWSAAARRVVPVADLDTPGAAAVVARGGKGGRGNGGRRAPARGGSSSADWGEEGWGRPAAGGMPGDSRTLGLELKVLADVGLVGLPNAGKSTLLGAISRASPRVGAWAFTTLRPTVGVVAAPAGGGSSPREGAAGGDASGGGGSGANRGSGTFRVADIPGLVAGAAADRGLGHAFLRHVERTRLLLYVVDASDRRSGDDGDADRVDGTTPAADWAVLRSELAAYGGGGLASRRCLVVATKMDTPGAAAGVADLAAAVGAGFEVWPVCASAGWGVPPLLARIAAVLEEERQREGGSMDEGGVERGGVGRWTAAELGVDPDAPLDDGNWEGGG